VTKPVLSKVTFKEFKKHLDKEFVLQFSFDEKLDIDIHGQWLPSNTTTSGSVSELCFVGTPMLKSTKVIGYVGLSLSDFAIHDPAKDRLFAFDALQASKVGSTIPAVLPNLSCDDFSESDDSEYARSTTQRNSANLEQCPFTGSVFSSAKTVSAPPNVNPRRSASVASEMGPIIIPSVIPSMDKKLEKPNNVLSRVLKRDISQDFELSRMLLQELMGDSNQEELIRSLCAFFDSSNALKTFFTTLIQKELQETTKENPTLIFRQETVVSVCLSTYLRTSCLSALREPIRAMIMKILESPPETPDSHICLILQLIQNLTKSASNWPTDVTEILKLVQLEYSKQDRPGVSPVCALLFLRLIGPMITCPERHLITTRM
jgi:hypothetical protein